MRTVADRVGIGAAFLYHLEVGSRRRLSMEKFKVLAAVLDVDRSQLLLAEDAA